MTESNEIIEAGARAIGVHRKGHGWERDEDTWRNYIQLVEWAYDAMEPMIRANVIEELDAGWLYHNAAAASVVQSVVLRERKQIADWIDTLTHTEPCDCEWCKALTYVWVGLTNDQ